LTATDADGVAGLPRMRSRRRWGIALVLVVATFGAGCSRGFNPDEALREGFALQQSGDLVAAADLYEQVLSVRPEDKLANYNLGIIEAKDGRVGLAEGYYRAALATDPDFPQALFNLAILRTAAGDSEEAIDLYLHAIELDPSDANALFNVGMLLRDSGQQKTAERYLNRALELDPTLADRLSGEPTGS
jgi:tetratricopeptide (TPR) repeat protein